MLLSKKTKKKVAMVRPMWLSIRPQYPLGRFISFCYLFCKRKDFLLVLYNFKGLLQKSQFFEKELDFEAYTYFDSLCDELQSGIICFAKTYTLVFLSQA